MARDPGPEAAAERLRLTLELFDDAIAMLRLKVRRSRPTATEEEIEREIDAWIAKRPGAEEGDYADEAADRSSRS